MKEDELLSYLEDFVSEERRNRFISVLKERTKFITVAIEDVYQMHNTSAVVRSCESFGIQEAHLIEGRFGKRLDKNIAMGSQQWVDIFRYDTCTEVVEHLRNEGYKIIATTPHHNATPLSEFCFDSKIALFFGTEREGLSDEVLTSADSFLKIPMVGFTESLNISVSAAIILQHLTSKLKKSKFDWKLKPSEILEKRLDWTKTSIKSIEEIMIRFYQTK
ncbi:MAG: RNA methyltransferase [Maribacter sp.]